MAVSSVAEAKKLPVARIREELAARGLPQDGLKGVIVKRLVEHMEANELQQTEEEPQKNGAAEAAEEAAEAEVAPAEATAENGGDVAAEEETPAEEPAAAVEETAEAEKEVAAADAPAEEETKPAVAEENAEPTAAPTTEDAAATTESAPDATEESKPTEGGKAPGSPASVGGGEDGPPSKKAKTANGASAAPTTKRVKLTGDPSGREIFIEGVPETATDDEVKAIAEAHGTVVAMRVMKTSDDPPKCKGLALVRYNDRESAKKALETIPTQKMGESALTARTSSNANTLFIGNLNKTWDKESVLKAFTEAVEGIVNFEITMDALNKSQNRGFGFATFDTVESCKAAHDKYYKDKLKIMENQVLIDWAETRGSKQDDDRGVYVLNVDENVEDAAFKAHFEKHGAIEKVVYGRLIPHARRKDFAIINFVNRESAKTCINEMNGTTFMGKELEVTMAKAKRKRDFAFGGGDRRSSGGYNNRSSYGGRDGGGRGNYNNRAPYGGGGGGGYNGGRGGGRGGGGYNRNYNGGGGGGGGYNGGGYGGGGGYNGGGYNSGGGPYMSGGGGGRGYAQPQPYPQYHAGGQQPYQQPVAAYPQPYGAQPVAQPYHAGGAAPQQQWPQQRQY